MEAGCKQSTNDPALFTHHSDGELCGMVCCHVDDFMHAGNDKFKIVMDMLTERFVAGKEEIKQFRYIGFDVTQKDNITIDQCEYIQDMSSGVVMARNILRAVLPTVGLSDCS